MAWTIADLPNALANRDPSGFPADGWTTYPSTLRRK
jgi:hypothetical protein